jgi:hypothetical protein
MMNTSVTDRFSLTLKKFKQHNYLVFDDPSSGVRIKCPSNRNVLERLGIYLLTIY